MYIFMCIYSIYLCIYTFMYTYIHKVIKTGESLATDYVLSNTYCFL